MSIYRIRFIKPPPREFIRSVGRFRIYPGQGRTFYLTTFSLEALKKTAPKFEVIEEVPSEQTRDLIHIPIEAVLYDPPPREVAEEVAAFALSRRDQGKTYHVEYRGRTHEDIRDTFILDRPGGKRIYCWRWTRGKPRKELTFAHCFPKLIKRITDPNTRFVVSLSGGALLMFAHPSVFKLIEAMGARDSIEEIWGCSGGAIAGMAYALGADHKIIEQEGYDIYNRKFSFRLSPSKSEFTKYLFSRLLPGGALSPGGFVDIQTDIQESLGRIAKHQRPRIPFYAIAFNLSARRHEVLTPCQIHPQAYGDLIKHCSQIDSVLASSAIPILFVPRVIRRGKTSHTYIDGGLFEEVPINSIYEKWRLDLKHKLTEKKKLFILSVNLFPFLSSQKFLGNILLRSLPILEFTGALLKLVDLVRQVRIDQQIKLVNNDRTATVVELKLPQLARQNFLDPKIIPTVLDKAREVFFRELLEIESKLT